MGGGIGRKRELENDSYLDKYAEKYEVLENEESEYIYRASKESV
jgi:hypothetical protein